jgi:DNA-binding NarL/FixJ family response regulator
MVGRKRDDPLAELSPREREVLELMAEGLSNKAISGQIHVSERMVERHITAVLSKLDIPATGAEHRRVLAVLAYLRG